MSVGEARLYCLRSYLALQEYESRGSEVLQRRKGVDRCCARRARFADRHEGNDSVARQSVEPPFKKRANPGLGQRAAGGFARRQPGSEPSRSNA